MKSFSRPPIEDKMINDKGYLTQTWRDWFSDTWQSMDGLATEAGVHLPVLTTAQRDSNDYINQAAISDGSLDGLMIYNSTTNQVQAILNKVWTAL